MPVMSLLPSRLLALGLRRFFVLLTISSFIRSLPGGVLLLLEFLSGFSYLAKRSRKFVSSVSFLRIWRFRAFMLRFNLTISAYCSLTVSRNSRISSVMSCNTFDISVTCSFIGVQVRKISRIRKENTHHYSLFTKILEEKIQTGQYR